MVEGTNGKFKADKVTAPDGGHVQGSKFQPMAAEHIEILAKNVEAVCLSYDPKTGRGELETKSHGKIKYFGKKIQIESGNTYTVNIVHDEISGKPEGKIPL